MDPQQLFSRLRTLASSFTSSQLATLALTFVLVVGVIAGSTWWVSKPTYELLFADMDPETAGQIVTKLKTQKVAYQLDPGGRGIRVPADRVDELRIDLTATGLPASGRVGFEIFDRTAFGATEFLEQVNYRRALEGEIARTISTISEVSSARVHIAMGKDSLFGESRPAKASVVLKLRGQRTLPASTVSGISNLVAGSVEGLRPEAVNILDSFGRPLLRPQEDGGDPLGAAQSERQQRLEREMAQRVVALLEPVVGDDRVRVNVALKLNPSSQEETEERYDPNAVVRSRQSTADVAASAAAAMVAGARANAVALPTPNDPQGARAAAVVTPPTGPSSSRSAETTNYEISRVTRHTIQPPGNVARLSVAVIIDDEPVATKAKDGTTKITRTPRKREDLQKIQGLVAAAVGLEADRGDLLTVENVSFEEPIVEEPMPPTMIEKFAPQAWEASRMLMVGGLGLMALLIFVKPLMKRSLGGQQMMARPAMAGMAVAAAMPGAPGQPLRTVADLESEIELQLDASVAQTAEQRRLPVLTKRVTALSAQQPESVAKLLRHWISESER